VPQPSRELLARAQSGDRAALEQLVREQQGYIYSLALGLARNADDAADIMQEACVKMARALPTYRAEARFTTWLYRLVLNAGLDLLRRRGRVVSLEAAENDGPGLPSAEPSADPERSAERADAAARTRAAVDRLPSGQRLALTLQYFEDLRYEEISEVMGIPLNTVKSHIRRGKAVLACELIDLAPLAV
jgi:RNA polymerase sigma-70 factor (ECF subfamily)